MVISVILDAALEKTLCVPGLTLGRTCLAQGSQLMPGGGGLASAMAVQRLGGRGAVIGIAGGAEGEYIRDCLERMGLSNDLVLSRAGSPTHLRLADGDRETCIRERVPAASERELQEVWQKLSDLAEPGDVVLFAGEPPQSLTPGMLARWIGQLRQDGVLAVLAVEPVRRYGETTPSLMVCSPEELCGARTDGDETLCEAAKQIISRGTDSIAVALENGESLFFRADQALRVRTPRPPVGAEFAAHIAISLDAGGDWREIAVRAVGGQLADVEQIY